MPERLSGAETPRSEISYAGFPMRAIGLWCPDCGLTAEAVCHDVDTGQVIVVHQEYRFVDRIAAVMLDTWYCTIQHGKV